MQFTIHWWWTKTKKLWNIPMESSSLPFCHPYIFIKFSSIRIATNYVQSDVQFFIYFFFAFILLNNLCSFVCQFCSFVSFIFFFLLFMINIVVLHRKEEENRRREKGRRTISRNLFNCCIESSPIRTEMKAINDTDNNKW